MKRILLVSPFPPYIGGVSVSVKRLYDFLLSRGYDVVRFNTQLENSRYNRFRILKLLKYFSLPFWLLFRKRFDVIHFHVSHVIPKLYVALWRPIFSKKTMFVITIHGQVCHVLRSRFGAFSLSRFDRIICVKKGDKYNLPHYLKVKTVHIPAFIPPSIKDIKVEFPETVNRFLERDSVKLLLNGFIIINEKFKDLYGFRDSIMLMEQLRERGKKADLILIVLGKDYDRQSKIYLDSLKKYCYEKKLDKNILWIEGETMELWPLLLKVDILLRPTKSDGDALSIRESLFLKKPVITSNAVPRPAGTVVYKMNSDCDLLEKTISLIDHYDEYVSRIGDNNISFAGRIIEAYEHR